MIILVQSFISTHFHFSILAPDETQMLPSEDHCHMNLCSILENFEPLPINNVISPRAGSLCCSVIGRIDRFIVVYAFTTSYGVMPRREG